MGTTTLRFSGNAEATFTYTLNGVTQTKPIRRQAFAAQPTTCSQQSASRAASQNYQDLWWVPSEAGWGINLAHQGDLLFATSFIDYNVRFVDLDGSGIDTIFMSSPPAGQEQDDAAKQGQYVLVNDGTGRLYAALHDEFRAMREQVNALLQRQLPGGTFVDAKITPQYIAYRSAAGNLISSRRSTFRLRRRPRASAS